MPYLEAAGSILMNGPNPFMVSLGIENYVDLTTAYMLYNYVAVGVLFFIAAAAGARSEARYCVVIPIFAGIFTWIGWLNAPDPMKAWAITIITGILGIAIYMNETNREKYGAGGPGNKLLNIAYFIILLQICIGLVNGFNLFAVGPTTPTSVNMCTVGNSTWGAQCGANGYVSLTQSVASVSQSGGLLQSAVSAASVLVTIGISILQVLVSVVISIVAFPVVLNSMISNIPGWSGIVTNSYYLLFLATLEAVCIINLTLLLFNWFYKPWGGDQI
jgi:hypothetical protein